MNSLKIKIRLVSMETRYVSSFMKKGDGVGGNDLWKGRGGGEVEEYMYVNMLFCWNKDFPETEKRISLTFVWCDWIKTIVFMSLNTQNAGNRKNYVINKLNKFAKAKFGLCFSRMHLQTKLAFVIFRTQNLYSVTYGYQKKKNKINTYSKFAMFHSGWYYKPSKSPLTRPPIVMKKMEPHLIVFSI